MEENIVPTQTLINELLPSNTAVHDWHYLDVALRVDAQQPLVRLLLHLIDPTRPAHLDLTNESVDVAEPAELHPPRYSPIPLGAQAA